MDKKLIIGITLIIIGLTPVILFASSSSTEVWSDFNWNLLSEGQKDFTIPNPNPLLGNKYMLIVGDYFTEFQSYIEGTVIIINKATGETQTFNIYIDATSLVVSWDSDHHVVILPPGEYTIFWQTTPIGVHYYIYSHGWFMIEHDEPREVNQLQNLITMISGFIVLFIAIAVIYSVGRRKKGNILKKNLIDKLHSPDKNTLGRNLKE